LNEKQCTKCGETYLAEVKFFPQDKRGRSGLSSRCRVCHRAQMLEYGQTEGGKASRRARDQRYKQSEKGKAKQQEWEKSEKSKATRFKYNQTEKGQLRRRKYDQSEGGKASQKAKNRRYKQSEKGKVAIRKHKGSERSKMLNVVRMQKRRARKMNLANDYTTEDFLRGIKHFGECCAYCSVHISECKKLHMDHYIPLNDPSCPGTVCGNIVPACQSCNSSKGDRDAVDWVQGKFPERANAISEKIEVFLMADGAAF